VLGMHIIGAQASSLIHTGVAAIRLEATLDDMATIIFAHPSFGEVIGEAVHDALGHAIHKL
jgi:dihydrolipoamide dehydrogenase